MTLQARYRARTLPWGSTTYILRQGALEEHPDRGTAQALALETVAHVNLRKRIGGRIVCSVETPDRRITFSSSGRGDAPIAEFREFVGAIHEQLAPYQARVTWSEGSRGTHTLLRGCTLVATAMILAAIGSLLLRGVSPTTTTAWAIGIGIAATAGILWPLSRVSTPAPYRPERPPLGLGAGPARATTAEPGRAESTTELSSRAI